MGANSILEGPAFLAANMDLVRKANSMNFEIVQNPDHSGWAEKQSQWMKQWRRRYFALKGPLLFFSTDEKSKPHGCVDLSKAVTVMSADEKARRKHAFEVR